MAMDPAVKAKLMKRIEDELDRNEKLARSIEKGIWEMFYDWLKKACADIWNVIKDYAGKIKDWVVNLFT